uniref:Tail sheath n=1 Tax=Pseudomonas phage HRDY3 TaxID=3236930 RepID=A0AB39CDK2_9VIRU
MAVTGLYVRRSGYTHVGELMLAVINDLSTNGFTVRFPSAWTPPVDATGRAKFKVTVEAGPLVDPLNATELQNKQPWRLQIEVFDKHTCGITAGSQQALRTDGSASYGTQGTTTKTLKGPLGAIGGYYTKNPSDPATFAPDPTKPEEGFINRTSRVVLGSNDISDSFPMTYSLSITNRGIVLCVWEDYTSDNGATAISWFVVQRPVDRVTGATIQTGKAPVFGLFGVAGKVQRFTVREADVLRPSDMVLANVDTDYNNAIINSLEQVAISEGNKYVVNFPSRLNTTRYAYTYELDMLGYTSADVVSENTDVPLLVYGEKDAQNADKPRKYVSLLANGANNTGMRIVAIKEGGGISLT